MRTLMNAIQAQRIHQAYLFTGSRGIGKTSIARIFAKAVRCPHTRVEGTWLKSCDECPSCKEIALGTSVDVIEIDGASNNGVDAIRDIRESAKYLPSSGSRKIYIIDEVHMLTTAAFNALLKTLEEPPAHVIFIFATTEPHKIPATILSRCQRFDFKRVTSSQIMGRITEVTQAEGVQTDPGALALISRAAEGSMRDALSILDQVIAFSGKKISIETARDSIGIIGSQTVLGTLKGVLARKPLDALALVNGAYEQGHDLKVLTKSLIEFLYGVILAKVGSPAPSILEASSEEWTEIQQLAELRPLEELELIFQVLNYGLESVSRSSQPKIVLDVILIKCATAETLVSANDAVPASGSSPAPSRTEATTPSVTPAPAQRGWRADEATLAPAAAPVAAKPITSGPVVSSPAPVAAAAAPAAAPKGPLSWEGFVEHVRKVRPLLGANLEYAAKAEMPDLTSTQAPRLIIAFRTEDAYKKDQLQARSYADELNNLSKEYFGRVIAIQCLTKEGLGESMVTRRERERKDREQGIRQDVHNHPIIQEAKALFGGELGPIEFTDPSLAGEAGGPPNAGA